MIVQKFSKEGNKVGEVELPSDIFNEKVSLGAIYDAIKAENANLRTGNHSTKTRSEVSGGGKKPWAQKGTGRARQGSIRAPQWVGGGIVHGPKKRDYSIPLSRNIKRKAVVSILNKKAVEQSVKLLEDVSLDNYSTKTIFSVFKNMQITDSVIGFVVSGEDKIIKKSVKNIPNVKYINSKRIACRDILYNRNLVITESALSEIVAQYKGVNK
ncbi:MAG: 50S ribosomal protein L4 [Leptospiraceae bacterium]|nr:50S ribosomal protein L4 [Leptospiraceae bacterium]MCP5496640.1 50S ribosomal protein L4 [Leptospiraceae bacterium]